jgi:hypothetical protein
LPVIALDAFLSQRPRIIPAIHVAARFPMTPSSADLVNPREIGAAPLTTAA